MFDFESSKLYDVIKKIVLQVLNENGLLRGTFAFGKVDQVISPSKLRVFINGSEVSQLVNCNPDVTFNVDDQVIVMNLSPTSSHDKFVISRRIVQ